MTTLIIARHGNTFEDGETPRRVGLGTDMKLTEKGRGQARAIGRWLKENNRVPDAIFCAYLSRAYETAEVAMIEAGCAVHIQRDVMFNEIDYGSDENKTDSEVVARIGAQALKDWDEKAVVPPGWQAQPQEIIRGWQSFAARLVRDYSDCTVLVVTSNGIARFAPYLTGDFDAFSAAHKIKISTGALCILESAKNGWTVAAWNLRP